MRNLVILMPILVTMFVVNSASATILQIPFLNGYTDIPNIGDLYHLNKDNFSKSCLSDITTNYVRDAETHSFLDRPINETDLVSIYGMRPSSFKRSLFAGLWTDHANNVSNHSLNRSLSFVYGMEIRGNHHKLSTYDRSASCEGLIVEKVEYGARILLKIDIVFPTHFQAKRFSTLVDLKNVNLENFFTVIEANRSLMNGKDAVISISANISGGKHEGLINIFANQGQLSLTCTIQSVKNCRSVGSRLYDYLTSTDGFINQFHQSEPKNIIAFHLKSLGNPPLQVNDQFRQKMVAKYFQLNRELKVLSDLRLSPFLPNRIKNSILENIGKIQYNRSLIGILAVHCLDTGSNCQEEWSHYRNLAKNHQINDLKRKVLLGELCYDKEISGPLLRTIESIMHHNGHTSCQDLINASESIYSVDIHGPGTFDLRPLKSFKNLLRLDLRDMDGVFWDSLEDMNTIENLTIRNTNLNNANWLEKPNKLNSVDLRHNLIEDLSNYVHRPLKIFKVNGNPCNDCESLRTKLQADIFWTRNKESCESTVRRLYKEGIIETSIYELAIEEGLGPNFKSPYDESSEIEGWYRCDLVATYLP